MRKLQPRLSDKRTEIECVSLEYKFNAYLFNLDSELIKLKLVTPRNEVG